MTERDDNGKTTVLEIMDGDVGGKDVGILRDLLINPTSDNFMGSGLDFTEYMLTVDVLRYNRWYGTQTREERQRRMQYLIELCAEQKRLVDESIQATAFSQLLIEAVIAGDWIEVRMWLEKLEFDPESDEFLSMQTKRFATFRQIAQQAYDTRPTVFCPVCHRPPPKRCVGAHHDGRHVCPWCDIVHDGRDHVSQKRANLSAVQDTEAADGT